MTEQFQRISGLSVKYFITTFCLLFASLSLASEQDEWVRQKTQEAMKQAKEQRAKKKDLSNDDLLGLVNSAAKLLDSDNSGYQQREAAPPPREENGLMDMIQGLIK